MPLEDSFMLTKITVNLADAASVQATLTAQPDDVRARGIDVTFLNVSIPVDMTGEDVIFAWKNDQHPELQGAEPFDAIDAQIGNWKVHYPGKMLVADTTVTAGIRVIQEDTQIIDIPLPKIHVGTGIVDVDALPSEDTFSMFAEALLALKQGVSDVYDVIEEASTAASNATTQAEYAKEQGDYAKQEAIEATTATAFANAAGEEATSAALSATGAATKATEAADKATASSEKADASAAKADASAKAADAITQQATEAEATRQSSEETRIAQESEREKAEAKRQETEAQHAIDHAKSLADAKQATDAANEAAETATQAANTANAATKASEDQTAEAKTATDAANEAATKAETAADRADASATKADTAAEGADTSAGLADAAAKRANAAAERAETGEDTRDAKEAERQSEEETRKTDEAQRKIDEAARKKAEEGRVTADSDREDRQANNDTRQDKNDADQAANNLAAQGRLTRILEPGEYDPETRIPTIEGDLTHVFCVPSAEYEAARAAYNAAKKKLETLQADSSYNPEFDGSQVQSATSALETAAAEAEAANHYVEWLWLLDSDGKGYWEIYGSGGTVVLEPVETAEIDKMWAGETVETKHVVYSSSESYNISLTKAHVLTAKTEIANSVTSLSDDLNSYKEERAQKDTAQDEKDAEQDASIAKAQSTADKAASDLATEKEAQSTRNKEFETAITEAATKADKLGTDDVGSATNPIHLVGGTATASDATVGADGQPVYLANGEITSMKKVDAAKSADTLGTLTVGSSTQPVYLDAGSPKSIEKVGAAATADKLGSSDVGSVTKPIYLKAGVPTPANDIPDVGDSINEILAAVENCATKEDAEEIKQKIDALQVSMEELAGSSSNATVKVNFTKSADANWYLKGDKATISTVMQITSTAKIKCTFSPTNDSEKIVAGTGYTIESNKAVISSEAGITKVTIKSEYTFTAHGDVTLESVFTGGSTIEQKSCTINVYDPSTDELSSLNTDQLLRVCAAADKAPSEYTGAIGKTITITPKSTTYCGASLTARVRDVGNMDKAAGGKCGLYFVVESGLKIQQMNSLNDTTGGYGEMPLAKTTIPNILKEFPDTFQNHMVELKLHVHAEPKVGDLTEVTCKAHCVTMMQWFGEANLKSSYSSQTEWWKTEETWLKYNQSHNTNNDRIIKNESGSAYYAWSSSVISSTDFGIILSNGTPNVVSASISYVPALGFSLA